MMGRDVSGLPTHERGIAYVPAQPVIPGWMRVRELLGLLPGSAGADRMLEEFGLRWASDRRAGELSTGERKVVQISMALSSAARAILLDEPFSNLSGEWASTLDRLLKAERRPLVISHQERVPGFDIYVRLPLDRRGATDFRCPAAGTFSRGDGPPLRGSSASRCPGGEAIRDAAQDILHPSSWEVANAHRARPETWPRSIGAPPRPAGPFSRWRKRPSGRTSGGSEVSGEEAATTGPTRRTTRAQRSDPSPGLAAG